MNLFIFPDIFILCDLKFLSNYFIITKHFFAFI